MMDRDDFGDHGDVLAGIEMNGNARNGDTENVRVLVVQSGTVHVGALTPLLELNDDLDALLLAHRADAEDGRNVHEPDAANLHVMALELVAASNDDVVAAATREQEIVVNDPVYTLDEIEHALGFADPALPDEQKPDTVDVGQRAVERGLRRERVLEPGLDARVELVRLERRPQDGDAAADGLLHDLRRKVELLGDEEARNREGEELRQVLAAHLDIQRAQVRHLRLAEHLESLGGKARNIAGEREPGTGHVRGADHAIQPLGARHVLELEQLTELLEEFSHPKSRRHARIIPVARQ